MGNCELNVLWGYERSLLAGYVSFHTTVLMGSFILCTYTAEIFDDDTHPQRLMNFKRKNINASIRRHRTEISIITRITNVFLSFASEMKQKSIATLVQWNHRESMDKSYSLIIGQLVRIKIHVYRCYQRY